MKSGLLTAINLVLTLLDKFVSWGQRKQIFKEDEALIALTILRNATRDIELANKVEEKIRNDISNAVDPNSVLNDEFVHK